MKKKAYQFLNLYLKENEQSLKMKLKRLLWYLFFFPLVKSYIPGSFWRKIILKVFGSKIGKSCIFKPNLRITKPWNLSIGNNSWLGESLWIDNLDKVIIEDNVCLSQGVYLCTGNHDFKKESFDLISEKIIIEDSVWVGAKSIIGPGSKISYGKFIKLGSIHSKKDN